MERQLGYQAEQVLVCPKGLAHLLSAKVQFDNQAMDRSC